MYEFDKVGKEVTSDFEASVNMDAFIWGFANNVDRTRAGLEAIKYDSKKELYLAYWSEFLSK